MSRLELAAGPSIRLDPDQLSPVCDCVGGGEPLQRDALAGLFIGRDTGVPDQPFCPDLANRRSAACADLAPRAETPRILAMLPRTKPAQASECRLARPCYSAGAPRRRRSADTTAKMNKKGIEQEGDASTSAEAGEIAPERSSPPRTTTCAILLRVSPRRRVDARCAKVGLPVLPCGSTRIRSPNRALRGHGTEAPTGRGTSPSHDRAPEQGSILVEAGSGGRAERCRHV